MTVSKCLLPILAVVLALPGALAAAEIAGPLPPPAKNGGKSLMETLALRRTGRDFSERPLAPQILGELLYAAVGVNRPDEGNRRTIPTARNKQDLTVYAALPDALYRYDAIAHSLVLVKSGDFRGMTFLRKEMPESAPVALIYVSDTARFPEGEARTLYPAAHAGSAYQNVYLYCASAGLSTVVCGAVDKAALAKAMNLPDGHKVIFTQIVGYPEVSKKE